MQAAHINKHDKNIQIVFYAHFCILQNILILLYDNVCLALVV